MNMNRFVKIMFQRGVPVAPMPLVFLSFAVVSLLQFPLHLFVKAGWVSAGVLANELLVVAGVPLVLIWFLKFNGRRLIPLARPSAAIIALVIVATFGADVVIDYMTAASESLFPLPGWVKHAYMKLMQVGGTGEIIWKLGILCLVPAVCEEIFFRGFCQTSLAARWGTKWALLITALLFAAIHGNPWYMHLYFALGLLLGWIYAATGSLWAPILCHFLNNAWTFLNHVRGFGFPLEKPVGWVDACVLAGGAVVLLCSTMLLRRVAKMEEVSCL